ncbi:MAG: cation:proton antiporter [Methanosarcinaceae archaeon]|nr:cation:proton antiporter [Methanosarcinaceae archaeon]
MNFWLTADGIALAIAVLATLLPIYRVLVGPTIPDRIAASDAIGNTVTILFVIYASASNSIFLFDIAVLLAIVSFIGTVAMAKYVDKGKVL